MILHSFVNEPSAVQLFYGTKTLKEFMSKLQTLGTELPKTNKERWARHVKQEQNYNEVVGAGFELFCELFFQVFGINKEIGIHEYVPVEEDDEGVDAYAKNKNGNKVAVQCKFRSNISEEFSSTNSNVPNLLIEARLNGIDWGTENELQRLFLITTAKGLCSYTIKKWNNKVRVINYKEISKLVDENPIFWTRCIEMIGRKDV